VVLKNMISISELAIDEEYKEIQEDVKEECSKFGDILSVKIPRPIPGVENIPGLGKIFVEYSSVEQAKEARKTLQGRLFNGNTVEVSYHDEIAYLRNDMSDPK